VMRHLQNILGHQGRRCEQTTSETIVGTAPCPVFPSVVLDRLDAGVSLTVLLATMYVEWASRRIADALKFMYSPISLKLNDELKDRPCIVKM
jgi:hypothetical protein